MASNDVEMLAEESAMNGDNVDLEDHGDGGDMEEANKREEGEGWEGGDVRWTERREADALKAFPYEEQVYHVEKAKNIHDAKKVR
tara:strand:+ start:105 stop:359 length:255 start_codon:yes stop_codon:yes gene_type:complete